MKLRYKKPDAKVSRLITRAIPLKQRDFAETTDALRFSAAVAQFALLLRDSAYKGEASCQSVLEISGSALGKDPFGYRAEFRGLVEKYKMIKEATASR